jgi:hypothetical protein
MYLSRDTGGGIDMSYSEKTETRVMKENGGRKGRKRK